MLLFFKRQFEGYEAEEEEIVGGLAEEWQEEAVPPTPSQAKDKIELIKKWP